ncbi:MAG: hypothetical protein WDZ59_02755 [Pirellulales bacterium]
MNETRATLNDTFRQCPCAVRGAFSCVRRGIAALLLSWAVAGIAFAQSESSGATERRAQDASAAADSREVLAIYGLDAARLAELSDAQPLAEGAEADLVLRLLYRTSQFDDFTIHRWSAPMPAVTELTSGPASWRGRFVQFRGRVKRVDAQPLAPELQERYPFDRYFQCEIELADQDATAVVLTTRLPESWPIGQPLDEYVSTSGMFLKLAPGQDRPGPVFAAKRIAWHPQRIDRAMNVGLGATLLGGWSVDIGLRDRIVQQQPITAQERELFYQMLSAMERAQPVRLARLAREQLDQQLDAWREQAAAIEQTLEMTADARERRRIQQSWAELRARIERAEQGADSVVPLFNEPESRFGTLVVLEGIARRAVPIRVGSSSEAGPNRDVVARFGIRQYYEIDLFTPDSQDNPVVLCVRDLPPGFPVGEAIDEPVRLAGFFFKSWAYAARDAGTEADDAADALQLAPLLIAARPQWLTSPTPPSNRLAGAIAGGLFVVALLGVWLAIWKNGQRDRQFARSTAARAPADEDREFLRKLDVSQPQPPERR